MVRRKTLSPAGPKDADEGYRNANLTLHRDELTVAGLEVGEEVLVRVEDSQIIVERSDF